MRILITGVNGQLGQTLRQVLQNEDHTVTGFDRDTTDITDSHAVMAVFDAQRPDLVIHCAALTAVDYCAQHPNEALAVNAFGTQVVAVACQTYHAAMLYVSTNEVFDGANRHGYREYDLPRPVNPYGYSKWVGEQMVRDLVQRHYIVRTSWLFSRGGRNFVQTILRLAAQGEPLRVVTNEIASPTYNDDLANACSKLITTGLFGIYHLVNAGHTSRYGFARQILDLTGFENVPLEPIALAEYPRASRPPEFAVLHNTAGAQLGIALRPWQEALAEFLRSERGSD